MPRLEFAPALPEGWAYSRLADACELISRGRSPQYVDHSPVKAIGQRCVRDSFNASAARGQNSNRLEGHLKALPGDVLLNSTGTGTIGRSCVFNDAGNFVVDSHVTVIRPQPKKLYPQWANMLLRSPKGQTNLETFCYAGSTNQVELARTPLAETEIPLPPLPEQRRIAAILDTLDRTIEGTQHVVEKLQATRQGLLHDLLTRGLDENGQLRDPEQNPEQFKETELGQVPREWEVTRLLDHVELPSGQVDPKQDPYRSMPLIAADHIESRTGRLLSLETAEQQGAISGKYVFHSGDVLYSKIRPNLRKALLASVDGICSADMYPLRCKTTMSPEYLIIIVLSEHFSKFAEAVSMRSGFPKINRVELGEYYFVLPQLDEQQQIATKVRGIDKRIASEQARLAKLQLLKRGLMEDLLTGRVRVAGATAEV